MMSNALSFRVSAMVLTTTTAPTTQPAPDTMQDWMIGLLAVGFCTLVVLTIRRIARPRKLRLVDTPGRSNSLSFAHILVLFVLLCGLEVLAGYARGTEWQLVAAGCGRAAFLVCCLALASMTFRLGLLRGLGLSMRHWLYDSLRGIVAYLAVLPVCVGLLKLTEYLILSILPEDQASDLMREHYLFKVLPQLSWGWRTVPVVIAVVLAPLSEEVFFRGLVQSMLRRYTARPWAAIVITSIIFALVHSGAPQSLPALFALSVVLGYNYERCGRLYPPILIHALFNGVFMTSQLVGP